MKWSYSLCISCLFRSTKVTFCNVTSARRLSFSASVVLHGRQVGYTTSICANYSPTVAVQWATTFSALLMSPEQISLIAGKCLQSSGTSQQAANMLGQGQSRMWIVSLICLKGVSGPRAEQEVNYSRKHWDFIKRYSWMGPAVFEWCINIKGAH